MKFSDEEIRNMLEIKDQLTGQIEKHQEEIELLEKNLSVIDSILKQSSFTKASSLNLDKKTELKDTDSIPITKGTNGEIIANAFVTPKQVSIILKDEIRLDANTPPFKSFFLDRIIGEMKRKDAQEAENGIIEKESVIDCIVNNSGSKIREIIIRNYRQKERVDEIINTAGWSLSRMIENVQK